jgi:Flp pilus assembly protein TadD
MRQRAIALACVLLSVSLMAAACATASPTVSGDAATLIQEAKDALNSGNADAAIPKLQQALRLDANSVEARFLLGNAFAKKEQFPQAEEQFLQALKLDANNTDARSNLGVVYYRQGKLQEAEKAFRAALSQTPNDGEIRYNLGGVLVAMNRTEEALDEFLKAKELSPSLAEPYLGLGSAYKLQGKREEAVAALREFLKRSKDPAGRQIAQQLLQELGEKP